MIREGSDAVPCHEEPEVMDAMRRDANGKAHFWSRDRSCVYKKKARSDALICALSTCKCQLVLP